jgi:sulfur-carrier protein adenylyltransferase/sulfurtransferase
MSASIDVNTLSEMISAKAEFTLIDVRQPEEYEVSRMPGSRLIPLPEFEDSIKDMDKNTRYVLHCKLGGRSQRAVEIMEKAGFKSVYNLEGGIEAWLSLSES